MRGLVSFIDDPDALDAATLERLEVHMATRPESGGYILHPIAGAQVPIASE